MGQLIIPLACRTMFSFENPRGVRPLRSCTSFSLRLLFPFHQIQNEKTSVHGHPLPICFINDIDCAARVNSWFRIVSIFVRWISLEIETKIFSSFFFLFGILGKVEVFIEFWNRCSTRETWYEWIFLTTKEYFLEFWKKIVDCRYLRVFFGWAMKESFWNCGGRLER